MIKLFQKKPYFFVLFIFWFFSGVLFSQSQERYFDTAELNSKEVRLAILHPTVGSIRTLVELRNQGFITLDDLIVIGVYHEKELTNFKASISYVARKKLEWFKFHKLSGELTKDNLFQKNPHTTDFEQIFKKSDGIIFFGGADIPPIIYKKKTSILTRISTPYRHFLELSCVFHLLGGTQDKNFKAFLESRPQYPVLGICLGCQSLNIGTGGTLIQDIPFEKYKKKYLEDVIAIGKENWHTNPLARLYPEERLAPINMHPIKLLKDGKFCTELGFNKDDTPYILSAHHQMVDKKGKGIKIIATSLDGKVVEAIEHDSYPNVLGVQFHPESPSLWDRGLKLRFTLEENEGKSLRSILEDNPPSFDFHKKIWAWLSQKLKEYHDNKK
ncbi:MAG: gamma-glutamyl-gamma-aminobutyrate hydrolase family protein [Candidatus Aminicenantes bacterium]|nr:MAG: gamma-glutamyl-gamma-aminobutyrate hydrolase family protein [Candidatus Aminicenantes bacterium]